MKHRFSLRGRLALAIGLTAVTGVLVYLALTLWPAPAWLATIAAVDVSSPWHWLTTPTGALLLTLLAITATALLASGWLVRPWLRTLRAVETEVASYRDGDFSFSLAPGGNGTLGDLISAHNALGQALRDKHQQLVQRELMLDTMVQKSPQALVLVDDHDRITFANIAARKLLNKGTSMQGTSFTALCRALPDSMHEAIVRGGDGVFAVELDGETESFQVSLRRFMLQGRSHALYLFRRLTRELSRQEVASWKRVIRVISHELNNSLGPISSLAHSGRELVRRGRHDRLEGVFDSISDRASHLHQFIDGYARFARLPAPRIEAVAWPSFVTSLARHCQFRLVGTLPDADGHFDPAQIEQALINLVKNAHESGSAPDAVELVVRTGPHRLVIEVSDRGPGMTDTALAQALLPFYSTKRSGTGLGLALAREIAEAHDGNLRLANRAGGGLQVTLSMPHDVLKNGVRT